METSNETVSLLLVNDRGAQLTAWQAILADLDQPVRLVTARSGIEALEHLLAEDFAAILLDVNMPGMDGFETASLMRQRPRLQHTPILFVTAINTEERDRARGYALGAVDYIFTPVVPEILRAKVAAFVELHRKTLQTERQAQQLATLNHLLEQQLQAIQGLNAELTAANADLQVETAERRRAEAQLRHAHGQLEHRVEQRTAELAGANAELQREVAERQQAEAALRLSSAAEHRAREAAENSAREASLAAEQANREHERLVRLQAAQTALARALTPEQVCQVIIEQAAQAFGTPTTALALLSSDGSLLELAAAAGYDNRGAGLSRGLAPGSDHPLAAAVRERRALWLESQSSLAREYPALAQERAPARSGAYVTIPLLLDDVAVGGLVLECAETRPYDAPDQELLVTLGRQCAQALERARLLAEARSLNAELEARVHARTSELRAANRELEQSREQLRQLSSHLQALREEERARIAREVHDDLGGALTGLKMDVLQVRRLIDSDDVARLERLKDLTRSIDAIVASVRRIATELRPALLDDFGLGAAIEWQLQEFHQRSGIATELDLAAGDLSLPTDTATALFRVFQEALTNVARHAQASRVQVALREEPDGLILEVSDNGRGIEPGQARQAKSFGLVSMRERIQLLAGELTIAGRPGQGTTILVKIPYQPTDVRG